MCPAYPFVQPDPLLGVSHSMLLSRSFFASDIDGDIWSVGCPPSMSSIQRQLVCFANLAWVKDADDRRLKATAPMTVPAPAMKIQPMLYWFSDVMHLCLFLP